MLPTMVKALTLNQVTTGSIPVHPTTTVTAEIGKPTSGAMSARERACES
jgi:hypothetical protein